MGWVFNIPGSFTSEHHRNSFLSNAPKNEILRIQPKPIFIWSVLFGKPRHTPRDPQHPTWKDNRRRFCAQYYERDIFQDPTRFAEWPGVFSCFFTIPKTLSSPATGRRNENGSIIASLSSPSWQNTMPLVLICPDPSSSFRAHAWHHRIALMLNIGVHFPRLNTRHSICQFKMDLTLIWTCGNISILRHTYMIY